MRKTPVKIYWEKIDRTKPGKLLGNWQPYLFTNDEGVKQILALHVTSNKVVSFVTDAEITAVFLKHSDEQREYLFAAVYPTFYKMYEDGGSTMSQEQIRDELKEICGFGRFEYSPAYKKNKFVKASVSNASKDELNDFITKLIQLAADNDYKVPKPRKRKIAVRERFKTKK